MIEPIGELRRFLSAALITSVPREHVESGRQLRRRRIVTVVTLVLGAAVMAWALRIAPGDPAFYLATLLLAGVWLAGAFASGPIHRGNAHTRAGGTDGRGIVQSLALATLLLVVFLAGALLVARIPVLRDSVQSLLDHARVGALPLVAAITALNGVAEELYFRGALYAAVGGHHAVAVSTVVYAVTTVPTGIGLLVLAATVLGVVTGLQRRVTGGVLGPIITHVTWSAGMLFLLPPVLAIGA